MAKHKHLIELNGGYMGVHYVILLTFSICLKYCIESFKKSRCRTDRN